MPVYRWRLPVLFDNEIQLVRGPQHSANNREKKLADRFSWRNQKEYRNFVLVQTVAVDSMTMRTGCLIELLRFDSAVLKFEDSDQSLSSREISLP